MSVEAQAKRRYLAATLVRGLSYRPRTLAGIRNLEDVSPWIWVGIATFVGAVLRFWHLASVPPALNQDEAIDGYDAYSIFQTGRDHLGHPFPFTSLETFGDWSSPLLTYLSIPEIAIFGLHVAVLRAVSAAVGTAAIPLVYLLAVLLFKRPALGVAAAALLAVDPWHVHMSRWAISPTVVPTMLAATLLVLVWSLERRSARGIVWAALLAALTIASYHSMKLYVPLVSLVCLVVYRRQLLEISREALAYAALVLAVVAGPILYLTWRDPGGGARLAQTSVFNEPRTGLDTLVHGYLSYFSPAFWFVSGDHDPMHLPDGMGIQPWSFAPLLLAGIVWLVVQALRRPRDWTSSSAIFLLLLIALYPAPGSITTPSPHTLRAIHVLPLAVLVSGAGVIALLDGARWLATRQRATLHGFAALGLVLVGAIGVELAGRYRSYFETYPTQVAVNFHYGLKDALTYAEQRESDVDQIWVADPGSAYIYVLFYHSWSPTDVHNNLVVHRNPPEWNRVESIGKYRFGLPPDTDHLALLFVSTLPDGAPAYAVRGGETPQGRILVIDRVRRED